MLLKIFLISIAAISTASAERVELLKTGEDIRQDVQQASLAQSVMTFEVGAFEKTPVQINGQTYWTISTGREAAQLERGAPAVPRICRSLAIPADARMKVNVLEAEYTDYKNTPVAPSKGNLLRTINPDDVPYTFGSVYNSSDWYPAGVAELREPYILRDQRAVVLEINAFQYHPATQTLRVYTKVTVEVLADGPGEINVLEPRPEFRKPVREFNRIHDRQFINLDYSTSLSAEYTPVDETGDMLVVVFDSFYTAMQPFVDWKRQKGIRTSMVTFSAVGGDTTSLKSYIQDFYDSTNLAWVLLVGDYDQIPSLLSSGGAADPCFVKLAGDDDYPDAFIGRFSAETVAEVETQVTRTIAYEKTPLNTGWLHKATGIGSDADQTGHEGEYDWEHVENLRDDLLLFTYTEVDQIYDPGALSTDVIGALNEGRTLVNYCGHGGSYGWSTTGFAVSHIDSLTNNDRLPLIYSVGCRNGNFESLTCFAEAWLRATHNGEPSGAVGTYMSSLDQDWIPPMDAQDEAVDLLTAGAMTTFGGMCFNSSCKMLDMNYQFGVRTYDTWHVFGDPSLQMRTDSAHSLTVIHDSTALAGYLEFGCEVTGEPGALCALYADGTLYGSAYTDLAGQAVISIEEPLPNNAYVTLTVTAFNALPYVDSVYVQSPAQPFVALDSTSVEVTAGNSNGLVDLGDSAQLGVQLVNTGLAEATNVQAVLRTFDPYVAVTDSLQTYGTIAADYGTTFESNAFAFEVASDIPDLYEIEFEIDIYGDHPDTAFDGFELVAHAPVLGVVVATIDDALSGDNDGILDPDESADIVVTLANTGSGDAVGVEAVLAESDVYLTLVDSLGSFGTIDSISGTADNSSNVYTLAADAGCPLGHLSTLTLQVSTPAGLTTDLDFDIIVGDRSGFWSDDFSSNKGWWGLGGPAEWTIGSLSGGGGDPSTDVSPTSDNQVLGNDLTSSGTYENDITETDWVVSPVIDCSNIYGTILTFHRWLGIEGNQHDRAYVEVFDGESWVRVFTNSLAPILETSWSEQQYNIAAYADYNPALRIRFGLGQTDGATNYAGWNIDDLEFSGYGTLRAPEVEFVQTAVSDSLQPGDLSEKQIWVRNNGEGTLVLTFDCDSAWLQPPAEQQIIPGGDSLAVTFTFEASNVSFGDHTADLDYVSNDDLDPSGSLSALIHVYAPDIAITDSIIVDSVHEWHAMTRSLTISNDGPGRLDYTVAGRMFTNDVMSPGDPVFQDASNLSSGAEADESTPEGSRLNPSTDRSASGGGPDGFGHYWIDSDDPGGPVFNWQDISSSGTEIFLSDDEHTGPIGIGFDFPFYDTVYSDIYISSNGLLTFGGGGEYPLNQSLPTGSPANALIALWWDNLDPSNGGHIYYLADSGNDRFIVSFVDIPVAYAPSGTGSLTFQIVIYASGNIVCQFGVMDTGALELDRATVGLQNAGASDALQIVFNEFYMHDSLAIKISTDHWLSTVVPGVPIEPYGSAFVDIVFDATDLSSGLYSGELIVVSNDPERPEWHLPVELNVTVNCCQGSTGNVNCSPDDAVDITDIQVMIDNLFLTLAPLCCEDEADTDLSGIVDITDLQLLIDNQFLTLTPLPDCP